MSYTKKANKFALSTYIRGYKYFLLASSYEIKFHSKRYPYDAHPTAWWDLIFSSKARTLCVFSLHWLLAFIYRPSRSMDRFSVRLSQGRKGIIETFLIKSTFLNLSQTLFRGISRRRNGTSSSSW